MHGVVHVLQFIMDKKSATVVLIMDKNLKKNKKKQIPQMDDYTANAVFFVILHMKSRQARQKDVAPRHEATPHPKNTSLL